ncbi:unnamed protein product [Lampetra planeri]
MPSDDSLSRRATLCSPDSLSLYHTEGPVGLGELPLLSNDIWRRGVGGAARGGGCGGPRRGTCAGSGISSLAAAPKVAAVTGTHGLRAGEPGAGSWAPGESLWVWRLLAEAGAPRGALAALPTGLLLPPLLPLLPPGQLIPRGSSHALRHLA